MWKVLIRLNKQLVIAIPVMLVGGFLFGIWAEPATVKQLKGLILPLSFLMVYPMMVTLNIKHLKEGMNVPLQLTTQLINFGIIPFLAYGLGSIFFPAHPYLALGLLLPALLPTSGMTISWTGFAKGNIGAAINMTVIGLTLGALSTPIYVQWLLGAKVDVNIAQVVKQIVLIVFLPMFVGYVTRQALIGKYTMPVFKNDIAPKFPALSTLGVLGIVFVAMALKSRGIMANPAILGVIFVPLLIIYGSYFVIGTLVGRIFFSRGDGIALVYGTAMRNLAIALAIAINAFGSEGANAALVIAASFIIQVQAAAWYVKLTSRIFGPAEVEVGGNDSGAQLSTVKG
ncbi:MAG: bile acid:sodium symporter [Desulfobulbaceae bacterium]|nr:bile acid:sodium symporter [Desulfobulbaceae bacterium]